MENKVNTYIARQLDQLDTLPAGYQPDLDSKWALLESALEKPVIISSRFIVLKRLGIAASLLLLIGIGWWMNSGSGRRTPVAEKNDRPVKESQQEPVMNGQQADNVKAEEALIPQKRKLNAGPVKIKEIKNDPPVAIVAPVLKRDSVPVDASSPLPEIAQEKIKKKKQRYVQMDFEGGDPEKYSQEEQTSTAFFRFRLNRNNTNESGSTPENTSPLKIKYNF